jgi:hypothetical protein
MQLPAYRALAEKPAPGVLQQHVSVFAVSAKPAVVDADAALAHVAQSVAVESPGATVERAHGQLLVRCRKADEKQLAAVLQGLAKQNRALEARLLASDSDVLNSVKFALHQDLPGLWCGPWADDSAHCSEMHLFLMDKERITEAPPAGKLLPCPHIR